MALTKVQGGVVKNTAQLSITSVNATGVITASSFVGSGANLTDIVSGVGILSTQQVGRYMMVILLFQILLRALRRFHHREIYGDICFLTVHG